jgi:predicted DNA repair protein MutK
MRRTAIAAAWIFGATVPLLMATVFIFGCCVLPFHSVVHKLMPICQTAAALMSGHEHDAQPSSPAKQKEEPVKRVVTDRVMTARIVVADDARLLVESPRASRRSFITHGAVRCDQDVGLHVLVRTFLI